MNALKTLRIENLAKKTGRVIRRTKKLVSIAQSLVRSPEIILMDEPTTWTYRAIGTVLCNE